MRGMVWEGRFAELTMKWHKHVCLDTQHATTTTTTKSAIHDNTSWDPLSIPLPLLFTFSFSPSRHAAPSSLLLFLQTLLLHSGSPGAVLWSNRSTCSLVHLQQKIQWRGDTHIFFPDLYSESSEIRIKCRTTFHGITTFHIVLSSMSVTHTVQSGHRLSDSHSVIHYNVRTGMKKHRCMHSGCMNGGCDQI